MVNPIHVNPISGPDPVAPSAPRPPQPPPVTQKSGEVSSDTVTLKHAGDVDHDGDSQ